MEYRVQKGDTIASVTHLLGTDWQTLKRMNPSAIGKSQKNGNWFLHAGKTVSTSQTFQEVLTDQTRQKATQKADAGTALQKGGNNSKEIVHIVKPGDTVWELAIKRYHVHPEDILRQNNISDPRKIQPGDQLVIEIPEKSSPKEVTASWYGEYFHGRAMANGDPYDMYGNTIAHKEMPLGTRVELENPKTGKKVRAVVTDRGPYVQGREVDLSYHLAQQLSLVEQGVGNLVMRVL